ncbi:HI1450 family dsDNA-mimic protein [Salinivibrio costicola]|uniref:DUF440 family protein n=1 Tax=Salinivibrio costicola subsp. alcaliphilus TaxID=272773 RepID=A0ABX3KNT0_SALCS|nr:HI1450 family dsDNA-mimic protein [Salinivibrio costicola]OOF32697.1 hypothetical protein BZJ21_14710 [Salinivibrio costicola subsp. alcaliphilus]
MTQHNLLNLEDIIEIAFDIFAEMAPDNLEHDDLLLFESRFEDEGGAIVVEVNSDWPEHVGADIDLSQCAEVQIGLAGDEVLKPVFARMLISRDIDNKFCHMLWNRNGKQLH